MRQVLSSSQMRIAERLAIEGGTSEDELIFRAANAAFDVISAIVSDKCRVCVLVGGGNNGCDGLELALLLNSAGHNVTVSTVIQRRNKGNEARLEKVIAAKIPVLSDVDIDCDIIIDGVFGIGIARDVSAQVFDLFLRLNGGYKGMVFALDIPSGLDADTGRVRGIALRATHTIAFGGLKLGHYLADGRNYCGQIHFADIGISCEIAGAARLIEQSDAALSARKVVSHKGNYGCVKIIAGSAEMIGASLLAHGSAIAALRSGAGYAVLCVPRSLAAVYQQRVLEETLMFLPDEGGKIRYDEKTLDDVMKKASTILIGPGLGRNADTIRIIRYLAAGFDGTLIIDADGLNALSGDMSAVSGHRCRLILTPHMGEFSRLFPCDSAAQDTALCAMLAQKLNAVVALKSATTIISDGQEVWLNITGTPAMAKAGSGDVLSGIMAAFAAQYPPLAAAIRACYHFGRAGERAAKEKGEHSLLAGDIRLDT